MEGAQQILKQVPETRFLIIGDGPSHLKLETLTQDLGIAPAIHFLGSRSDIPEILQSLDVLTLTSYNEASPVSILEALSCSVPVISAEVGSVPETIAHGKTGLLFAPGDTRSYADGVLELLENAEICAQLGHQGREAVIEQRSLKSMIAGYKSLL